MPFFDRITSFFSSSSSSSASIQDEGYYALEEGTATVAPREAITLQSIYNQLNPPTLSQGLLARRAGESGYCRTWAMKDMLVMSISGALTYGSAVGIMSISNVINAGEASRQEYNSQVQNNDMTCSQMFGESTNFCDGKANSASYAQYFTQCYNMVNDYCTERNDGMPIVVTIAILGILLGGSLYAYRRYKNATSELPLNLTEQQRAVLKKASIEVTPGDTAASLRSKIEPVLEIEAGITATGCKMPSELIGIVNSYHDRDYQETAISPSLS